MSHVCLNYFIYKRRERNFGFMKLEFNVIYYTYLNESSFKYYISILGGVVGLRSCLFCLFRWGGGGGAEFGKLLIINIILQSLGAFRAIFWIFTLRAFEMFLLDNWSLDVLIKGILIKKNIFTPTLFFKRITKCGMKIFFHTKLLLIVYNVKLTCYIFN